MTPAPGDTADARAPQELVRLLRELDVEPERGLSPQEVEERLRHHGPNRVRQAGQRGALRVLADQFRSTVIIVLAVAGVLALVAGQGPESIAIFAVLFVNGAIGFVSEWRARRSMQALRELERRRARVRRGGRETSVPVEDLVPGDVLLLAEGDVIPADARVLSVKEVRLDEAALTGESVPVRKAVHAVPADRPLAERTDMLFKGTTVVDGEAEAVVLATGQDTELGRIAELAEEAQAAETPLEQRLDRLGRRLAFITLAVAALIAATGLLAGRPVLLMLETAVALGIAAVPEGLPIVATLALARGMWLMARRHAVMNRLAAVETLGATRVIFSDKTGTLTANRMTLRCVDTPAGEQPLGSDAPRELPELARRALEVGVLCNGASLEGDQPRGDPMEVALLRAGEDAGLERPRLLEERPAVREVPFDREVMMMASFHRGGQGTEVAVKGAPRAVLEACTRVLSPEGAEEALDEEGREAWLERARELGGRGLRLLAVADKQVDDTEAPPYEELRFLGFLGLLDPPREGVREAVDACRRAGLRVLVVTGDQAETAGAVAREVGLAADDEDLPVLTGRELPGAGEEVPDELRERILDTRVFARVSPEQKLALVRVFQEAGEIVAMTGDGVNDAPALKKADIGVAMGRRGTDAAREVSDMVLRDDALSSIVAAVEQGRVIFGNIRKSVLFMLCTNAAEVVAVAVASFAPIPLPLRPLQILYLNVLTDVFPALALGVGPGPPDVMERAPRDPRESVLTRAHWTAIGLWAALIGACVLGAVLVGVGVLGLDSLGAVTLSFLTLGFAKLWFVFNLRDRGSGLLANDVVRNPWIWASIALCAALLLAAATLPGLSGLLETRAPDARGWAVVLAISAVPVLVGQTLRIVQARRR